MQTTHAPAPLIASDRIEGTPVRRPDGSRIGRIERLMIDKRTGQVAYAVMSFGGFLGIGEDYHALPWGALKYNVELDAYELDITEEQLRNAPNFPGDENFNWSDRDWGQRVHDHYQVPPYWGY
ncbi:PRC-barrel domain-containing protein [Chelatococcus sp. SYSU_G07232]|uniref:PRC-barrel domain-containing protein n=1 Tax=Chelatococcus albus TaxID=3047466 RepID=A0ABT7AJ27_9HYPH|nr:PRC-barrel domain-containing protein [Chelatococcus sp. SYSU_G07232]MDJ1159364.1 PRC-barrel domain-containing protein [Chelatococcus sp. SYSU_G07232]